MGKVRARSSAVLKRLRGRFCEVLVFAGAGWGPELPIALWDDRGGSGARTPEGADRNVAGAPAFPTRFRLRYSRIHAALSAGSL